MRFVYDDFFYGTINEMIKDHDLSKLSEHEFVQYRRKFYPTAAERDLAEDSEEKELISAQFGEAWKHHKKHNLHHWESAGGGENTYYGEIDYVCMVCDWMAMSDKFGGTAQQYYEDNKEERGIKLDDWVVKFIYEIFERVYPDGKQD